MTVEIRPAQRTDADTLTAIAHAAKRSWRYPEEWIRLWSNELTVTPDFIERNPQRGSRMHYHLAASVDDALRRC